MAKVRTPIGARIRRRRQTAGLSQVALARSLGISASYLNLIENNKRSIGGSLLRRIGERLGMDLEHLSGEAEARAIAAIAEMMTDPALAGIEIAPDAIRDLVARFPEAAAALWRIHRAYVDANAEIELLQNRLKSDPLLSQTLHEILNRIAGMKSGAEILSTIPDLTEEERNRFVASINAEARDLVPSVHTLVAYLDQTASRQRRVSPMSELDEAIIAHNSHFPKLEDAADRLRGEIATAGRLREDDVARALDRRFGIACRVAAAAGPADTQPETRDGGQVLDIPDRAPAPSRLFRMLRAYAEHAAPTVLDEVVRTLDLASDEARLLARRSLSSYVAGAIMMPYGDTLALAEERRYDIELMGSLLGASFEQVAHRLVTLRRKGAEGVPFGLLRADRSGRLTKRFPIPGLAIPGSGHGCPLWPIYDAFGARGVVRQVSVFPSGGRFLLLAKAVSKHVDGFDRRPLLFSIMLACDMLHADRTVYGLGVDPSHPAVEVGPSCLPCPRLQCSHRQEMPV